MKMKTMILAMATLLSVTKAYCFDFINQDNPNVKIHANLLGPEQVQFEFCTYNICHFMGRESGYSRSELDQRYEELIAQAQEEEDTNQKILGYSVLVGAAAGGTAWMKLTGQAGAEAGFSFFQGALIGGTLGTITGISIMAVKRFLFDDSSEQADALNQTNEETQDKELEVKDFYDFASDLSMALSGIN